MEEMIAPNIIFGATTAVKTSSLKNDYFHKIKMNQYNSVYHIWNFKLLRQIPVIFNDIIICTILNINANLSTLYYDSLFVNIA